MGPPTDMDARDNQHARSSRAVAESRAYVLVADAEVDRAAACLDFIKPFNVNARVARDGDEALNILRLSGAPVLLIVDLTLPRTDGFGVIEAVRAASGRAEIIAWSSTPDLREFATHRLAGLDVKVFGGAVGLEIIRGAVDRALRRGLDVDAAPDPHDTQAGQDVYDTMTQLSERARKLSGAAGVAVYWKAAGETKFRASVTWASDTPVPHSPYHLPRVFGWILETGEALVMPDVTARHLADVSTSSAPDVVRGLVAVPIVGRDEAIVGTICVFDLQPLTFGDEVVEELKALGREGLPRDTGVARVIRPVPPRPALPERVEAVPAGGLLARADAARLVARELARLRREQRPLSVIAFDVRPSASSDEATSAAPAAEIAEAVAETLVRAIRASDLAVRWSADDVLLVLPGLGAPEARQVAERVRAAMQASAGHGVAVSGGVAELLPGEAFEDLVARAKEKLQLARQRGHNRVA